VVIDWENSGAGEPRQELLQAAYEFGGDDPAAARAFLAGYRDAGGVLDPLGIDAFALAFVVQANLVALYAERALTGPTPRRGNGALGASTPCCRTC